MQTFNQFQAIFEQYMAANRFEKPPAALYEPVDYILSLGGKRLRPAMLLLGYSLFDEAIEKALPAAFAVEIFHNFSLVHDDIMDAAPLRRGKETVHSKYGLNAGILSGDVMLASAFSQLLRLRNKKMLPAIMEVFTRMAIEVCEGQQMDMDFETTEQVSIAEYLKMIELKTSVLVAASLKMGAMLAGASSANANHLYEFGRNLGIAFQLQDDLLDTFGDPNKVGKKVGGDIVQNKKTFLYLQALALADDATKGKLLKLYAAGPYDEKSKVETVTAIFRELRIGEITERLKESYWVEAIGSLRSVEARENGIGLLEKFAENLMQREF
ncbi:MAG: polyprenyl synthetase family protein [Lewinellaceae bacterium]|nr:polyprenyl synthetase family protein [Saprospiraceae bacterium]MCB9336811.1 polyprenyl synthetase family protein [Lewinellaceae bacterium]